MKMIFQVGFLLVIGAGQSRGALIFSQDFSSSTTVAPYVSSTPDSGQWNAISSVDLSKTSVSIVGGALQFFRMVDTGSSASFSRTMDFAPTPLALTYRFELTLSGNAAAKTTAATWQVGSGFGTANSAEINERTYARFGVNLGDTAGTFSFRDIGATADSSTFSGTQSILWVINNSGTTLSYVGPDSMPYTVANDKWDLWAGSVRAFYGRDATTPDQSLTDLKFAFEKGIGSITMDNFSISAVPEPSTFIAGALLVLPFGVQGIRYLRNRKRA